jgi:flavin-dependent dehydrogenase
VKAFVVGGGPVGWFTAICARQAGMEVTLLEQRAGVLDKACGEGIMPTGLAALARIGVDPPGVPFRGIRYLDASGRRQVRADLPHGAGRGVRRTALVAALQRRGGQLGVVQRLARVDAVTPGRTPSLTLRDGDQEVADVIFGCDGLGSTVRSAVGVDRPAIGQRRYGLRAHFRTAPWSDDVEVYWSRSAEAYVTPVADDLVGVAILGDRGMPYEQRLRSFPALARRLAGAEPLGPVLGAGPLRRQATTPVRGGVLLVGDAAGYVDALTGEGLSVGFAGAEVAVAAVLDATPERYAADWAAVTRRFRWGTELLLRGTQRSVVRRALLPASVALPGVFSKAVAQLA